MAVETLTQTVLNERGTVHLLTDNTGRKVVERSTPATRDELSMLRFGSEMRLTPQILDYSENSLTVSWLTGRHPEARDLKNGVLPCLMQTLRIIHERGPELEGHISLAQTLLDDIRWAQHPLTLEDRGTLSKLVEAIAKEEQKGPLRPLHGDVASCNILIDSRRVRLIDWEYAGMGHPAIDLAGICFEYRLTPQEQLPFLAAYLGKSPTKKQGAILDLFVAVERSRDALRADSYSKFCADMYLIKSAIQSWKRV